MATASLGSATGSRVDSAAKHTMTCKVDGKFLKFTIRLRQKYCRRWRASTTIEQERVFNAERRNCHEYHKEISRSLLCLGLPARDHNTWKKDTRTRYSFVRNIRFKHGLKVHISGKVERKKNLDRIDASDRRYQFARQPPRVGS